MDQKNQSSSNVPSSNSTTENTQNTNTQKKAKKSGLSMIKLIIGIIIIAGIAYGAWSAFGGSKIPSDNIDNMDSIVATVNGEEISDAEFAEFLTKQKALIGDSQVDIPEDVFKKQILDLLISKKILLQKVKEANVVLTTEDLDAQLAQIKSQFPDDQTFTDALSKQGFTQESFTDALREDMVVQKYIDSQIDISSVTVTDEEIQAEYDLAITKQDNLPGIDVLGDPIKAQLLQQKQQQLVTQLIEKLKSESDIELAS